MKWIILIILIVVGSAHAGELGGAASDFGVGPDTYCVVAATPNRLILELRKYSNDQLLHDIVLMSRYMVPEYKIDDVVLDDPFEIIVRTRFGGTSIAETHLEVFGFVADKIVRFGGFVINRKSIFQGYCDSLSGEVSFPKKNYLLYRYKEEITEAKTVMNKVVITYIFNPETLKYEKAKEPEPDRPPDRR